MIEKEKDKEKDRDRDRDRENKSKITNKKYDKIQNPVISIGNRKERRENIFRSENNYSNNVNNNNINDIIIEKKIELKNPNKTDFKTEKSVKILSENDKTVKNENLLISNESKQINFSSKNVEKSVISSVILPEMSDTVFLSFLLNFR